MITLRSCFTATALLLTALSANAAIYRVGVGSGCTHSTIQSAIGSAAITAEADEIRVTQSQSYVQQALLIDQVQGTLELLGGYASCTASTPTSGARTVIDGTNNLSVLRINDTRTVYLANLDIVGGTTSGNGGGINASGQGDDILSLFNTLVRNNQAANGGGVSVRNNDPQGNPDGMQLVLFGNSSISSNVASNGGGIHCNHASVIMLDSSFAYLNSATGYGGGLYAQDCRIEIASRGANGAVIWSNNAGNSGGGIHLLGAQTEARMLTVDAFTPSRIVGNSASVGGGVALNEGAALVLYDANIEDNTASVAAGAVMVESEVDATGDTRFTMLDAREGDAPSPSVPCDDAEACNRVTGNQARSGNVRKPGAAIMVAAGTPYSAHARFQGTRIEGNVGESLTRHSGAYGQIVFNGSLLVDNDLSSTVLDAPGTANSLAITASTIAQNLLGVGRGVIVGSGGCNPEDDARGTFLNLSIIEQSGHPLIEPSSTLISGCFLYLIGNAFPGFPEVPQRVIATPEFRDASNGDFRLLPSSAAIDFAPFTPQSFTRDGFPRNFDSPDRPNRFGTQDLGAYEYFIDRIFVGGFEDPNA